MKKVLIYGAYGSGNAGDDYMMTKVRSLLEQYDLMPVFLTKPVWKNYFGLPQKSIRSIRFPLWADYSHANRALKAVHYLRFYMDMIPVRKYDAAFFMGGGYTYEKFGNLRRIQFLSHFLQKHGIPYYMMGQTAGPLLTREGQRRLRYIYGKAEAVFVRERFSLELLEKMGISCQLTGDDAFLAEKSSPDVSHQTDAEHREGILVTVKSFPGYEKYSDSYFDYIRSFAERMGQPVRILPFHLVNETEEGQTLLQYLKDNGIKAEICRPVTEAKLEKLFQSSVAVISSAYHAVVLGKKHGCICQAWYDGPYYRMKMEGFLDLYEKKGHLCCPFSDLGLPEKRESVLRQFEELCREPEDTDCTANRKIAAAVQTSWEQAIAEVEKASNG